MSFSSDIKDELYEKLPAARHCMIAELSALMRFGTGEGQTLVLCEKLREKLNNTYPEFSEAVIFQDCCKKNFLKGAFLAVGTLSAPERGYDLEFVCPKEEDASLICDTLLKLDFNPKKTLRRNRYIVYTHDGDSVVDFLGMIEAHRALLEMENVRVVKELRGQVNRRVNCETANLTKQANAYVKQREAIEKLMGAGRFPDLPGSLREIAELRLANPDASLEELGAMLDPPVGKSGVNHRLRRLVEMAEKGEHKK